MTERITSPTPTTLQVSGENAPGEPFLAVLVKRTYRVDARGDLAPDGDQPALAGAQIDPARRNLLLQDADIYPHKPLTDIVVVGHAYAPRGERRVTASIKVGAVEKAVLVTGDRRASLSPDGAVRISDPAPFDKMPLSHDRAYGGLDADADERFGNPFADLAPYLPAATDVTLHSPYLYPRNPSGRGYLVAATAAALERAELPNLEDPSDPIGPERIAAGSPRRWPLMPLPWALGWQSHAAFPRIGYTGAVVDHEPLDAPFTEVARGLAPPDFPKKGSVQQVLDPRFWNGASLGLQIGPLGDGVEKVPFELKNLHPSQSAWSFRLPKGVPVIRTDGRKGKLGETTPVLHHVVIEPDLDRVTVVWRGSAPALRRYVLDELLQMPLLVEW